MTSKHETEHSDSRYTSPDGYPIEVESCPCGCRTLTFTNEAPGKARMFCERCGRGKGQDFDDHILAALAWNANLKGEG